MRGLQDAVQAAVNGSGLDDLLLDAGVPADLAPLANDLAGAMDGGWAFAIDFWPHLCTLFSLLAAMYIVGSNWLNQVRCGSKPPSTAAANWIVFVLSAS